MAEELESTQRHDDGSEGAVPEVDAATGATGNHEAEADAPIAPSPVDEGRDSAVADAISEELIEDSPDELETESSVEEPGSGDSNGTGDSAVADAISEAQITNSPGEPTADAAAETAREDGDDTLPSEAIAVATTLELPVAVEPPADDTPEPEDPRLGDVGHTFAAWLRGRFRALGTAFVQHRALGVLLVLACVGGLLAGVIVSLDAAKTPPDERIDADARSMLAPPGHSASAYSTDAPLVLQDVRITGKHPGQGDDGSCLVDIVATFVGEGVESRADGQLVYQREGDTWTCTDTRTSNASHRATAGVHAQSVIDHVDDLLIQADERDDSESLATLYRDASVELTSESFDEERQTDDVVLHCASAGTFVNYECDLSAHFRFVPASGAWELAGASVDDGAYDLGLGPLVGTWRGGFTQQQSSSSKCLAAHDKGLTVQISSAAMTKDGGAHVEGTLTGTAHMHGDLTADAQHTEGDQQLDAVPFSGDLAQEETGGSPDDLLSILMGAKSGTKPAGIVFDCTTQDLAGGKARLTLTFGQADDPDAASATLTSTFGYEETFLLLVPVQREARFEDHFILTKT